MEPYTANQKSIGGLIRRLADDAQTAIRKELELARVELSERAAKYGRHTAWLAAGVSVAYGGIIILFMCLGVLLAWLLIRAGIEEILAIFAGFAIMAVLTIAAGIVVLLLSVKKLKTLSLVPKKAVHEAKHLAAEISGKERSLSLVTQVPKDEGSSADIQAELQPMHNNIGNTVDELKDRLTWRSVAKEATLQMKFHPVPTALLGAGATLAGLLMVRKARRRSHRRGSNDRFTAQTQQAGKTDGVLGKLLAIVKAIELLDRAYSGFSAHRQSIREKYPPTKKACS